MGVFLSRPSVTKFSEDGEDDCIGFGVSSMQGWRRGMEDAHVALLDVGEEGGGGGSSSKIRMFGVFDGHGGKEVALFVQEHMAEELTKLQEYRGGDFPGALVRVFHRMDELLEGAATELLRSRGMLPEEGGDVVAAASAPWGGQGQGGKHSEGRADATVGDATTVVASAPSTAASDSGKDEGDSAGSKEDGAATQGGGGGLLGGEGAAAEEGKGASVERYREILNELSEFRSRKNPSDLEAESRSSTGRPMLGAAGADYDSDEDDEGGAPRGSVKNTAAAAASVPPGRPVDEDGDEVLELGTAAGGEGGAAGGRKIKMADALELFHRILDIRKDQHKHRDAKQQPSSSASSSSVGGGDDDDASSCPPATRSTDGSGGGDAGDGAKRTGDGSGGGGGGDQMAPSAGGIVGGGEERAAAAGAGPLTEKAEEEGKGEGKGELAVRPAPKGAGGPDDEGEDTFGDSDESDEEDVVVTPAGDSDAAPSGAAGVRPRLGLGASLASIVHGGGAAGAPMCNLQDHPIQAGCTSVVCIMAGNVLHVANAGDSRAVLCRGGVAVALSHDHKPMSVTEKTRIQRAGGFVNAAGRVNGNLNLSRSIGDLKYKGNSSLPPADQMITAEPDVKSVEVTGEDRFMIIACDGVWDCMTSQECVDFVGARVGKMSLSKVCEEVMDACLSDDPRRTTGIGGDNMTCIVVLLDKSFSAASAAAGLPPPAEKADEDDGAAELKGDGVFDSAAADAEAKPEEAKAANAPTSAEGKE